MLHTGEIFKLTAGQVKSQRRCSSSVHSCEPWACYKCLLLLHQVFVISPVKELFFKKYIFLLLDALQISDKIPCFCSLQHLFLLQRSHTSCYSPKSSTRLIVWNTCCSCGRSWKSFRTFDLLLNPSRRWSGLVWSKQAALASIFPIVLGVGLLISQRLPAASSAAPPSKTSHRDIFCFSSFLC